MGRKRRRAETRAERGEATSGYIAPASPTRPPAFHIYFEKDERLVSLAFIQDGYAAASIKYALSLCEGSPSWRKDHVGRITLQTDDGLSIRAWSGREELESLMELDHIPDDLPEMMRRELERLILGRSMFRNSEGEDLVVQPKEPRKKREPRAPREPKARKEVPAGMHSAAELAAAVGLDPGKLRGWLRANVQKPDIGWLWNQADFDAIKAKVQKAGVK